MKNLKLLQKLDLHNCGFSEIPPVIFEMNPGLVVDLLDNDIETVGEEVVKHWVANPDIAQDGQFKNVRCDLRDLEQPPYEVFRKGAQVCYNYYWVRRAARRRDCCLLNLQLTGAPGCGKTSLIRSLKSRKPSPIRPVADENTNNSEGIEVDRIFDGTMLLQVYNYANSKSSELMQPLFMKSSENVVGLVVDISEYTEERHDALVTKWLSLAGVLLYNCPVFIILSKADLCTGEDLKERKKTLMKNVEKWVEFEFENLKRSNNPEAELHARKHKNVLSNFKYYSFSCSSMLGVETLFELLNTEAKNNLVLPKYWLCLYKAIFDLDASQGGDPTEIYYRGDEPFLQKRRIAKQVPREHFSDQEIPPNASQKP